MLIISDAPRKFEFKVREKLGADIVRLENILVDPDKLCEDAKNRVVLLRVQNMYKLIPITAIVCKVARKAINSIDLVTKCINRELLYSVFSSNGIPIPKRYYVFDLCNISDVRDKVKGKTLLLTFTKSEIEGFVESPHALISLIEHRYFMSAEDVKVNLFIPEISSYWEVLVVGREPLSYSGKLQREAEDIVNKVINILGEGLYLVKLGRQGGNIVVLDVDPVPEIRDEYLDPVLSYLETLLH